MKKKAAGTHWRYVSLLMAAVFMPLAVPAAAQEKIPTLRSPAAAAAQVPAVISPQQAGTLTCNLWNQPQSSVNPLAYANQDFEAAIDQYDIYFADDFTAGKPWLIDTIFVPGGLWNGGTTLADANSLHFEIYRNIGGKPDGDPRGSGRPPVWSLTVPPTDARITIEADTLGTMGNVMLTLDTPAKLSSGAYWLVFYPEMDLAAGQYGRFAADTANLSPAQVENPDEAGEYGGLPPTWSTASDYSAQLGGFTQHDLAFCLQGKEGFFWPMFLPAMTGAGSNPAWVIF